MAERRYQRRRDRHIRERDQRRLAREFLKEDYFDTWITVQEDQEQDQIHAQMLAEIQGQDTSNQDTSDQDTSYQDARPQKRRYSSEALDSTDPTERRYLLRKRQLTPKAAALIIK